MFGEEVTLVSVVYIVAALTMFAVLVTVLSASRVGPRLMNPKQFADQEKKMLEARKEAMQRSSHFEILLTIIGSFQLGVLAYVGGVLTKPKSELAIDSPELFFTLTTILFVALTVAYLHSWKIYMSYGTYVVQLELAALTRGLRTTSRVFELAQDPPVPRALKGLVTAASSIQLISVFPVVVLATAVVGVGFRLGIANGTTVGLAGLVLAWSGVYVAPSMIEFLKLVRLACDKDYVGEEGR